MQCPRDLPHDGFGSRLDGGRDAGFGQCGDGEGAAVVDALIADTTKAALAVH